MFDVGEALNLRCDTAERALDLARVENVIASEECIVCRLNYEESDDIPVTFVERQGCERDMFKPELLENSTERLTSVKPLEVLHLRCAFKLYIECVFRQGARYSSTEYLRVDVRVGEYTQKRNNFMLLGLYDGGALLDTLLDERDVDSTMPLTAVNARDYYYTSLLTFAADAEAIARERTGLLKRRPRDPMMYWSQRRFDNDRVVNRPHSRVLPTYMNERRHSPRFRDELHYMLRNCRSNVLAYALRHYGEHLTNLDIGLFSDARLQATYMMIHRGSTAVDRFRPQPSSQSLAPDVTTLYTYLVTATAVDYEYIFSAWIDRADALITALMMAPEGAISRETFERARRACRSSGLLSALVFYSREPVRLKELERLEAGERKRYYSTFLHDVATTVGVLELLAADADRNRVRMIFVELYDHCYYRFLVRLYMLVIDPSLMLDMPRDGSLLLCASHIRVLAKWTRDPVNFLRVFNEPETLDSTGIREILMARMPIAEVSRFAHIFANVKRRRLNK